MFEEATEDSVSVLKETIRRLIEKQRQKKLGSQTVLFDVGEPSDEKEN